ncbi:MAG: hypothetical protein KC418_19575 [Anaerolineales bacterium]|nr:hypothetical protein [Anaerolineales bacterium]
MRKKFRTFSLRFATVMAIAGSTLWYVVALIQDRPSWLRGVSWQWGRFTPTLTGTRLALLLGLAVIWLLALAWVTRRRATWSRRQIGLLLLWSILFTPTAQLVIAAQHRVQPLSVAFLTTTLPKLGFFYDGVRISDPNTYIREHVENMPTYLGVHQRTQPFGWSLAFWAAWRVWERFPTVADRVGQWLLRYDCTAYNFHDMSRAQIASATLQMSLVFLSGLGAIPLFGLARRFFSPAVARLALVAYPLIPGFLVFQAYIDVLYALVTLVVLWLAVEALMRPGRRAWWPAVGLGGVMAFISLFSIGVLINIVFINFFLILYIALRQPTWPGVRRWVGINAAMGAALLALWLAVWFIWGVFGLDILAVGQGIHADIRITYPVWLLFNLYDAGIFMGLPWLLLALGGGGWSLWRVLRRRHQAGDVWLLGWSLFLLLLNASGQVRAETGRLWLFLAVPGMLAGVATLARIGGWPPICEPGTGYQAPDADMPAAPRRWVLYLVFVVFGLQAVVTGCFLSGPPRGAAAPERQTRLPMSSLPLDYRLGDGIALQGYNVTRQADAVDLTLYWRSLGWVYADELVFVHLLDGRNQTVSQQDRPPQLPTWCWTPGEVVTDHYVLGVNAGIQHPLHLEIGMYSWPAGTRLPVTPAVSNDAIVIPLPDTTP